MDGWMDGFCYNQPLITLCYIHFAVVSDCSDGAGVAFMLDNADISPLKFHLKKEFIKKIMKKIVKRSPKFNAAIVLYNHHATVQLNFTKS